MPNPFDQFDAPAVATERNPFDAFDAPKNPFDQFDSQPVAQPVQNLSQFLTKADPNALSPFVGETASLANPAIQSKEEFEKAYTDPLINLPKPENTGAISGFTRGIETVAEGLTSPENIALLASIEGAPAVIKKIGETAFRAMMIKGGSERIAEGFAPGKTTGERVQAFTEGGASLLLGGHPESRIREPGSFSTAEPSQEMLDKAATQRQLNELAPATADAVEPKPKGSPDVLDGLQIARRKLLDNFKDQPPEVQAAKQQAVDNIDEALLAHDKDAVNESRVRTTPPEPATPAEAPEAPRTAEIPTELPQGDAFQSKVADKADAGDAAPLTAAVVETGLPEATEPTDVVPPTEPPTAEATPEGDTTSIKNAVVDPSRVERGIPERELPGKRAFGTVWDEAKAAIAKGQEIGVDVGKNLVDELSKKNRPLTDLEDAILTHEQNTREQAYNEIARRVNEATDPAEKAQAQSQLESARDAVHQVYDVGQKAGTANARGLAARRLMIRQDYTLAKMEARARAANGSERLTEKQNAELKTAHDKLAELEKKIADHESKTSTDAASHYFDQLLKETKKDAKEGVKQGKKVMDFISEQADKARQRIKARGTRFTAGIDPVDLADHAIIGADYIAKGFTKLADWSGEMIRDFSDKIKPFLSEIFERSKQYHDAHAKIFEKAGPKEDRTPEQITNAIDPAKALDHKTVYDLARAHVRAGVEGFDDVMKATHADLAKKYPDLTQRHVNDAFSEYGKVKFPSKEADKMKLAEYRRLGQLTSAIEDAQNKISPQKTGLQREKPTQAIREKMAELRVAMDKAGIETHSPEEQLASRNQARATALRNRIEDLDKQLKTGEKPSKGQPVPDSNEVEQLRSERDAMKEELKRIEDEANPPKTPEQIRLEAYKTRLKNATADVQQRLASGDYLKPKRDPLELDKEAQQLKTDYERQKQKIDSEVAKISDKNRTPSQKFWDAFVGIERAFKLSSDVVLAKLTAAAAVREGILTPAEEAVGGAISKALPELAKRAPREGGLSLAAEIKAKRELFTSGMKDAYDNLRMRKSDLEVQNGARRGEAPPKWYEYLGFLHAALKAPVKRAEFARSLQKRMEFAAKEGRDLNDPNTMLELSQEAYSDGQRAIFMQDNVVSKGWNAALATMEKSKSAPNLGPAMARVARFFVPIVKVGTNIAGETAVGVHGALTGATKAAIAYAKGIEKLPPSEADTITRYMKKGLVGNALLLFGYFSYKSIGGFYTKGKDDSGAPEPGHFRVNGTDLPPAASHSTAGMLMNIGATIHRVEESRKRKGYSPSGALAAGTGQAAAGLLREVPFVPAVSGISDVIQSDQGFEKYIHQLITSTTTPSLTQHVAKIVDTPGKLPSNLLKPANKRTPQTALQSVEMGIPGLRQKVPAPTHR